MNLTAPQHKALYCLHAKANRNRNGGFSGVDAKTLAAHLDTSEQGAARTASSLVRRGLAVRFVGGVGRQRVHWAATDATDVCPHGCGLLDWVDDQFHCPRCGDEWHRET